MKKMMIGISLALLALAGCRLKDEKEFVVVVPALTKTNEVAVTTAIRNALVGCVGVDASVLKFDPENQSVTVRYDSMQTAKKNIEFAIAKIGFQANDVKTNDVSYVTKPKSDAR